MIEFAERGNTITAKMYNFAAGNFLSPMLTVDFSRKRKQQEFEIGLPPGFQVDVHFIVLSNSLCKQNPASRCGAYEAWKSKLRRRSAQWLKLR